MGAITRSIANNITTGGVFTSSAITNASVTGITTLANVTADGITFISSQTASASASISFTSGLTSTYKAYKFVFVNCHPATNDADFVFNLSTDSGSNYNVTKTTTAFVAYHYENDSNYGLEYDASIDLAQSTSDQIIAGNQGVGNDNDQSISGSLTLFNPSSTTYVKHFIISSNTSHHLDLTANTFVAGYANTTSAINAIRFKFDAGNIDDGKIYLYGIK
jgi:hypothetical protein